MRELVSMWRDRRMVGYVAASATVYVVALLPFKILNLVPTISGVRPAGVLPVVLGLLVGPAAAWGAMTGNVVADLLSPTSPPLDAMAFGALGNFFFGLVGYKLWGALPRASGDEPSMTGGAQFVEYAAVALAAAAGTAAIISWGLEVIGLVPFSVLGTVISVNNFVAALLFGPPILYVVYPRLRARGALYWQVLDDDALPARSPKTRRRGAAVVLAVTVAWLLVGTTISLLQGVPLGATFIDPGGSGGSPVQIALGAVAVVALAAGCVLAGAYRPTLTPRDVAERHVATDDRASDAD